MTRPVPLDVADLVTRILRRLLPGAGPSVAGIKVSTDTGRGRDGGPPSVPWLLVALDGHTWSWPAVQRATVRLTCWHTSEHAAKQAVGLAVAVLCDPATASGAYLGAQPVTAPQPAVDPYTGAPLATGAVTVFARTPRRP